MQFDHWYELHINLLMHIHIDASISSKLHNNDIYQLLNYLSYLINISLENQDILFILKHNFRDIIEQLL